MKYNKSIILCFISFRLVLTHPTHYLQRLRYVTWRRLQILKRCSVGNTCWLKSLQFLISLWSLKCIQTHNWFTPYNAWRYQILRTIVAFHPKSLKLVKFVELVQIQWKRGRMMEGTVEESWILLLFISFPLEHDESLVELLLLLLFLIRYWLFYFLILHLIWMLL